MTRTSTPAIFLLEQDASVADSIRTLCHKKLLSLASFDSCDSLLKALETDTPSCIIVANDQPTGQALTLMSHLNEQEHDVPVIILGSHNDIHSAVASIKAGALDYIDKPVIYGRLVERLTQLNLCVSA